VRVTLGFILFLNSIVVCGESINAVESKIGAFLDQQKIRRIEVNETHAVCENSTLDCPGQSEIVAECQTVKKNLLVEANAIPLFSMTDGVLKLKRELAAFNCTNGRSSNADDGIDQAMVFESSRLKNKVQDPLGGRDLRSEIDARNQQDLLNLISNLRSGLAASGYGVNTPVEASREERNLPSSLHSKFIASNPNNCKLDLLHLKGMLPKFNNELLNQATAAIINSSTLKDAILYGKSIKDNPQKAAKKYLNMASKSDRQATMEARDSQIFSLEGKTDDQVIGELAKWTHDYATCESSYSGQKACSAIMYRLQAIGFRAVAAELACFGNEWPGI
jgi:hypothetical protein